MKITGRRWVGAVDGLRGPWGLLRPTHGGPCPCSQGPARTQRGRAWAPGWGNLLVAAREVRVCRQHPPLELWVRAMPGYQQPQWPSGPNHCQLLHIFFNLIVKLQCSINTGFYFWFPEVNFERINVLLWHWKISYSENGTCCWINYKLVFFFSFGNFIGFKC